MAKYECHLTGDFDTVLARLDQGILEGSMSASFEDGSDYIAGEIRCAVRVYERYSCVGSNRVSLNLTLVEKGGTCFFLPSPREAVRPCFSRSTLWEKRRFWISSGKWQSAYNMYVQSKIPAERITLDERSSVPDLGFFS